MKNHYYFFAESILVDMFLDIHDTTALVNMMYRAINERKGEVIMVTKTPHPDELNDLLKASQRYPDFCVISNTEYQLVMEKLDA
jgi:hypothetical protein